MLELGVSLYPEQETIEQIDDYLSLARSYGFTKVFTSLFSVEGEKEEIISYFKNLCDIAHKHEMQVYGDCNAKFFMEMGATPKDLSVFKKIGLDVLRLDLMFGDDRDVEIVNNDQSLGIQLNASTIPAVERILERGGDPKRIIGSYNFYPLRNTGADAKEVQKVNRFFKEKNMKTQIFISSNVKGAHGPWPVSDGLPTIEQNRDMPVGLQLRHVFALGADEVIFGNAFVSKEEFEEIRNTLNEIYVYAQDQPFYFPGLRSQIPIGDIERLPVTIDLADGVTDTEKEILFVLNRHNVSEYTHIIIRSRWGRMDYRYTPIPARVCEKEYFVPGDVVILNDNVNRYKGEVHIVVSPIRNTGTMNYVGRIAEEEMFLLEYMTYGTNIGFLERK